MQLKLRIIRAACKTGHDNLQCPIFQIKQKLYILQIYYNVSKVQNKTKNNWMKWQLCDHFGMLYTTTLSSCTTRIYQNFCTEIEL